ncbi:MAG: hypothetical protein SGILL_005887 [Bacillariaceae sp.]
MTVPVLRSSKSASQQSTSTQLPSLPPLLGKFGSIVFFLALFGLAHKNIDGYEQFRKCHGNCVNGLLHFVGMPPAVAGVFLIVRAASNNAGFTRLLQSVVTSYYLYLYTTYEEHPLSPWLFYAMYMTIWECLYHFLYNRNKTWRRRDFLGVGIFLIAVNVGGLESVGHGVFEHHHR